MVAVEDKVLEKRQNDSVIIRCFNSFINTSALFTHTFLLRGKQPLFELALELLLSNMPVSSTLLLLWHQSSQTEIVDHILNLLDTVLDAIRPLTKRIVLEVQNLEAGMDMLDEFGNRDWARVIALSDAVAGKTGLVGD